MPGKQQFKPGDLVFAKMKGYPHWPARVCKLDEPHKKRLGVFFFGTHQIGHLLPENLVPFSGNKLKYGTGVRLKGFSEGMWEIQNTPGIGKKSTLAAKSPPAKPVATSKTACAAAIPAAAVKSSPGGADANVAAVKTSSEAASRAGGTLLLKECVVKCVPAKTLHDHLSGANELPASASQPASAVTASDSGPKSELVTKTLRRSSFRSSAQVQLEEKKIDTQTRQEASMVKGGVAGQTPGSTPRRRGWPQRRGRPRNIPAETKSDVLQAKDSQTAPSDAHVTPSTLRLKPCVVKCIPAKTPDTHKSASEPARPSAPTPAGDLATAQEASVPGDGVSARTPTSAPVVKRKPGRPRKIRREESQVAVEPSKRTPDFPSLASANAPADSHGAAPAPKMADQAQPAATQTSGIDDGAKDERHAEMEKLTPGRRGGKRKRKEEAEQEGGEKGRTKMMPEVSTARRGGKKMRVDGEKQEGAEKGKAEVATEESRLSRGGKRKRKETKQEGELEKTLPSREGKKKVGGKEETKQKSDKEGKTGAAEETAAAEEPTPSRRKRDDAQQEKIEAIAEETSPSQVKGGKKEQTKQEGKTEAMQSLPSRGGKRKEETEQKRSAGARTEATAEEASGREGKTKRKAREDTKQMGREEGKAVLTTHETAPRPGEKSKTKEARKEEEAKPGGGGDRLAKTQGDPAPSQEDGTQTNQREEKKRSGDEEAKTRATAEDSTLSSEEKTNEGKKEETKQVVDEEGKATAEGSTLGEKTKEGGKERNKDLGDEEGQTTAQGSTLGEKTKEVGGEEETEQSDGKEGKPQGTAGESTASPQGHQSDQTKQLGDEEGKTKATTEEPMPGRDGRTKRKEREEAKHTKVTTDEFRPSRGDQAKAKEGKREESKGGKTQARTEESRSSHGEGEKEETKPTGGKDRKTERTTTEESTLSREGKMKTKGYKEEEEEQNKPVGGREGKTKVTSEESALCPGEKAKTKEGQKDVAKQTPGKEAKTTEESTVSRRGGPKDDDKQAGGQEGKTKATAEEASRGEKRKRKEGGQREKTQQEGGQKAKPEMPAEESTPGPGGGKRQRRLVEKDQSKRLGHQGGEPEVAAEAGKSRPPEERRGKVTRADAHQGADRENCKSQSEPRMMDQETRGEKKSRSRKAAAAMEQSDAAEEEQQWRRRWRLAAKRESVLKSLRGLLKASRGAKRRDAGNKSFTKAAIRAKRPRGHALQESNARKKVTQPPATASPPAAENTNATAKQSDGNIKDARPPSEDELQRKDAKKLIGKIVKATTKVQVKTMMGGATVAPPEEEKAAATERTADLSDEEERKPRRVWTEDEKAGTKRGDEKDDAVAKAAGKRQRHEPPPHKDAKQQSGGRSRKANAHDNQRCDSGENHNVNLTPTDSTLHRIHGDIRISLKSHNPDVAKCLAALDQLSGVYVTSQHVHRHSELISTLRKMRFYRANQDIMDKAAMLYNRFKNAFLLGEGEEVVSAAFLRSLLKEKEREEAQRCKKQEKAAGGEKDDVQGCQAPSAD